MNMLAVADQGPSGTSSQERILDAAEAEFVHAGFGGAGMKAIAPSAGVAQALLHYHFGSKEKLYEAVIARRAATISASREKQLEAVDLTAEDALEGIFDAIFRPTLVEEDSARAYAVIFSGKKPSDHDSHYLIDKYYDPTARKFIAALQKAEPRASLDSAAWSYTLAIGAIMGAVGQFGRVERLTGKAAATDKRIYNERLIQILVANAVGGLRGLIESEEQKKRI